MKAIEAAPASLPRAAACRALGLSRAAWYRHQAPAVSKKQVAPHVWPQALCLAERQAILETLHSERFVDQSPPEVYATLLDEGIYLCSIRTMYRLLQEKSQSRERRRQATHPSYARPELLATRPGELWSWDITKLRGPVKGSYFPLYVILDVFSRYVVGWMVAGRACNWPNCSSAIVPSNRASPRGS